MYNALATYAKIECVILENKQSSKDFILKRFKKNGVLKTAGQLLFIVTNKISSKLSQKNIQSLISNFGLNDDYFPNHIVKKVENVNSKETIRLLTEINPDAVVVNGTRIISRNVLSSINATFINTHMGITPRYRGVHGGYWALANRDPDHCGVTVHLVDQGIDTGGVLYQDTINTDKFDNFNTYPIHQIAKAIPLMKAALKDIKENRINVISGVPPSNLWYHPTIIEYLNNWLKYGVR